MFDATPTDDRSATYAAYADELAVFVRGRVPSMEVEDLLQEVWSAYVTTISASVIVRPRAWLFRVARNRIADLYRSRSDLLTPLLDVTDRFDLVDDHPTVPADPDLLADRIGDALLLLPPKQREVFTRNEIDGETLREIAADLGEPLKTIISRKGYARRRLRELLAETYEDYFSTD